MRHKTATRNRLRPGGAPLALYRRLQPQSSRGISVEQTSTRCWAGKAELVNRVSLEFHATTLSCTSLNVAFGWTVQPVDVQVEQFFPSGSIVKNGLANMMRSTATGPDRQGIL